ncbi:MAG: hypothetical protein ACUZ8A_08420, partial [Candidatus Bathyanammoxibius sp.]
GARLEGLRYEEKFVRGSSAEMLGWIAGVMEMERDKRLDALVKGVKKGAKTEKNNDVRVGFEEALQKIQEATGRRFLRI